MSATDSSSTTLVSDSGVTIKAVYDHDNASSIGEVGKPGTYPFARGPYTSMYRSRPWTMRQYAGFATAAETNERFRYLLDRGQTGLSVAFDLPTQLGLDSDDPRASGEVGRTGVAIDTLDDVRALFDGIPLSGVSTSMTINAPASVLLLMYHIVAEEQGGDPADIQGTIQNDILKEYVARGNYIYPPAPSMRLTVDTFAWCRDNAPRFNTISISGYHIREAGSSAVQELAFTLAHGSAYVRAAIEAGLDVDDFAPRLSFFFNAHNDVFAEVAKFRAARVLWARIMRETFEAKNPKSWALRFHAQTGGSTLTAQQPENNIARVAVQAFSAAAGGAQSIHTNGFDEALALPTEASAQIALRTQQILAFESGVTSTVDPMGGSWYVESLTAEFVERAKLLIDEIEALGGAVHAVENGWTKDQIEQTSWTTQQQIEVGDKVIVGVNRFVDKEDPRIDLHRLNPDLEREQCARLAHYREQQDRDRVASSLAQVVAAASTNEANLLPYLRTALVAGASLGELCSVLREAWGEWDRIRPS